MVWWIIRRSQRRRHPLPFAVEQRVSLVNVKLKWVKDRTLDSVVARERHLLPALHLLERISSDPRGRVPANELSRRRRQLGLPDGLKLTVFLRRFPAVFRESSAPGAGRRIPCFALTDDALRLRCRELQVLRHAEMDLVDRLRRLLMLTTGRALPLHTVDQLRWDMGLQPDYHRTFVPRYPHFFDLVRPPGDERIWLKLASWDDRLAVSELQKAARERHEDGECLAFPVRFTRGYGLKKKCMAWLQEWQTLPYTSPYSDASGLDPRTDVSEKRIVGVFHELLHLTLGKKTERRNVSNLRKPLGLPQKFTKVFERHPGIFYLSQKLGTQTVVLREAYCGGRDLLIKHPLVEIRERYLAMMRAGMPARGRRTPPKEMEMELGGPGTGDTPTMDADKDDNSGGYTSSSEICDFYSDSFSEDDSDEVIDAPFS
ncbi:protein WHAT'S THIS FACTOR 9, mitochondrial [Elaeis guineensis]|uniref:Protein WHAT'S THIS FACTOR 9, mitochondrial n=1 Tax=Elaeis guineensis var. tenera TaxID=51953 RepID=A0A6J0PLQ5_ELAGV|nr:protein WHAT'S THIS FACTOR 9, mitochondrial [Elaeis guineensis]XP_019707702.1 protein WHAT'S THIS FACTOR 9, mitochondrial [Elaeis guineensis]XP_029121930.1 protein WHAT'S THIS FACTOR 9, mitochondrial [Elaeis guineensis]XP_029121931.1 protein WHAT'S THIS FACTOR 9, mitochondrial [Elaeis guineensis]XP_029121932.1 protein WHAT'S THIS FACTOR 9, mitochondrial [Elaeis guineensis]